MIVTAVGGWITQSGAVARLVTVVGILAVAMGILALVSENVLDVAAREGLLVALLAAVVFLWAAAILRHAGSDGSPAVSGCSCA